MRVVATAGHVDHGKSTLVRALTGTEPDRWAEEHRRGLTIDLGYAWMTLPDGEQLAFVDVPGHQRFIGNMLAGLGPAPAVLFVVAADEGWREQSAEHLAAIDALGLGHGLLVVTRSDLADPAPATVEALEHIGSTSLGQVDAVQVSGRTGQGLDVLVTALGRLTATLPQPDTDARVRLWVDRSFTIRGSGTVVTGTLGAGTLRVGDRLELHGEPVTVRGLHRLEHPAQQVPAVARVAVNLRSVPHEQVSRGDVLTTPGAWHFTSVVDVRLSTDPGPLLTELVLHVGSAALPARVRALGPDTARLTVQSPVPAEPGDRAILRDPGRHAVAAGLLVLDVDPPPLRRRGAAARRAEDLRMATGTPDARRELLRRGAAPRADLTLLGISAQDLDALTNDHDFREIEQWLVTDTTWKSWTTDLRAAVDQRAASRPLDPAIPEEAARRAAGIPDVRLIPAVAADAGLRNADGRVSRPETVATLGPAEPAVRDLERRLAAAPFDAPDRNELAAAGLGTREIAAAVATGRLMQPDPDDPSVVLLPDAPAVAVRNLRALPQPFTTSQVRQTLETTRRVVIPLLEYLDAHGWTRRVDSTHRELLR